MRNLIHEIHRRSLWQVLGIYLAGSWVVLQIVDTLAGALGLPEWAASFALFLLIVGLPIVLATAFIQGGLAPAASPVAAGASGGATESSGNGPPVAGPAIGEPADAGGIRGLFTWRRALLGGGAAFAALGVITAGYLFMRAAGIGPAGTLVARGVLEDRSRLIISEFGSETGDSLLARATTEAFRVDLGQSLLIRLVEPAAVASALTLMDRSPEERLTPALARQVAQREGVPALIEGEVNSVGVGYVLSARLVSLSDGVALASDRQNAADSTEILDAIDRLSRRLRERIGESFKTLADEAPLARVTTHDLEALRLYGQAEAAFEQRDDFERAVRLLEDAVARDSAFAMAWRKKGILLSNEGIRREQAVDAITRAYRHRDRLTQRERYITEAAYHTNVQDDHLRGIETYQSLLEIYPEDGTGHNNIGVQYWLAGDFERALPHFEEAYRLDPASSLLVRNAGWARLVVGDVAGATEIADEMLARFPENRHSHLLPIEIATAEGRWEEVRTIGLGELERGASGLLERDVLQALAYVDVVEGRLADAAYRLDAHLAKVAELGDGRAYLLAAIERAWVRATLTGEVAGELAALNAALDRFPLDDISAVERPYLELAELYASVGRVDDARRMLATFETEGREELQRVRARYMGHAARGELALATGDPEAALEEFRGQVRLGIIGSARAVNPKLAFVNIARAHDAAGRPDSARAYYERYLEQRSPFSLTVDAAWLGPVLERLAVIAEAEDDLDAAQDYNARLVELWSEADPEFAPRVANATARIEDLVRRRG